MGVQWNTKTRRKETLILTGGGRRRSQRWGKSGGLRVKLRINSHRSALPSIFLANMRSLVNKLDELKIWTLTQKGLWNAVSCFFSETWLSSDVSNRVMELEGHTLLRADRSATASCKSHGGGVCIYLNKAWCTDSVVVDTHCSADLEFLFIKCRAFYLPREFTCVVAAAVPQMLMQMWL